MPRRARSRTERRIAGRLGVGPAPPPVRAGVCRVCGCTDTKPCWLRSPDLLLPNWSDAGAEPCSWVDAAHTLCSNPACVAAIPLGELERIYRVSPLSQPGKG